MTGPARAAIALGSNIEDPQSHVQRAFDEIAALPGTKLLARSRLYRTAPVGYADQPDFVNACALVETTLPPRALLEALLDLERRHGRVREMRNGPRTLDLDIVAYGERVIDEPGLCIPHPRAHERAFVLQPLVDVWPDAKLAGKTAGEWLGQLDPGPSPRCGVRDDGAAPRRGVRDDGAAPLRGVGDDDS